MILVTGGAGFIGSNFILSWLKEKGTPLINLDKLTYAGNLQNLASIENDDRHHFIKGDIGDRPLVKELLLKYKPKAVINFAAETHVDRSIHAPSAFVESNIVAAFNLLDECRSYWDTLEAAQKSKFRFIQISTDEVFGSLHFYDPSSREKSRYCPNSPYSASKAAADHLVRSYHETYGFPTITTHCTNNFGPYQFPEKLIPLMVVHCLKGKKLPIYGNGKNVRSWLHVLEHCRAIRQLLELGAPGEVYNIGDLAEYSNIEVVTKICQIMDQLRPQGAPHTDLIEFVKDRPGHDKRYSLDINKIRREVGFVPQMPFDIYLKETIAWYLENLDWVENITSGSYREWIKLHYQQGGAL